MSKADSLPILMSVRDFVQDIWKEIKNAFSPTAWDPMVESIQAINPGDLLLKLTVLFILQLS